MFVEKKIAKEVGDNEFLLEQIQDETVKQRLSYSLKWYSEKAVKNKYYFYFLSGCTIVFPILAEIFLSMSPLWDWMQILSGAAIGVSAIAASFLALFDSRRNWGIYRDQAEFIKAELSLFNVRGQTVPKTEQELLELVEQYMKKTHEKWSKQFRDNI